MKKIFFLVPALFLVVLYFSIGNDYYEAKNCPFCKTEVLDRQKLYEDDLAYVLYTHRPVTDGHCLIIPKRHVERFEELSSAEALRLCELVNKVHATVSHKIGSNSYLLLQKNGRNAGQSVPHVHIHYLPRDNESMEMFLLKMFFVNVFRPISSEEMGQKTANLQISR